MMVNTPAPSSVWHLPRWPPPTGKDGLWGDCEKHLAAVMPDTKFTLPFLSTAFLRMLLNSHDYRGSLRGLYIFLHKLWIFPSLVDPMRKDKQKNNPIESRCLNVLAGRHFACSKQAKTSKFRQQPFGLKRCNRVIVKNTGNIITHRIQWDE